MGSASDLAFAEVLAKYDQERDKRLRPDGLDQYADIGKTDKYKHFGRDPWRTGDNLYLSKPSPVRNGDHKKILIVGAGYGALLFAVRFMDVGFKSEDMVLVDSAWGFGGTWYWNRYPGLMCDVESACYLPLLEETKYTPRHRYSYGPELRAYAELVAAQWNLSDKALFGSTVQKASWDDDASEWVTTISSEAADGKQEILQLRSDVFVLASGFLNRPKLPRLHGLTEFKGHMFHTSRWDYDYTGGTTKSPDMNKLLDKKVAFLGTGATGIQAVPQLAKWAQQLTVLQRTPSAVSDRGQRPVDAEQWARETRDQPGWQRARRENMAAFVSNLPDLPSKNLVDDGWTYFPSFSAVVGSPRTAGLSDNKAAEYVEMLHRLDFPRQEAVRRRVVETVNDQATATSLQPWYPGWCKRPCFHDEYLDAFNLPNVTLVDTGGRGIEGFTQNGIRCNGNEIEADLVVLGTGFESFSTGSPAFRAGMVITGRRGLSIDEKWQESPGTFHGVFSRDFPNLILSGFSQAGSAANVVHTVDVLATHAAHVFRMAKAATAIKGEDRKILIEPTEAAEETWSMRVANGAQGYAWLTGCTPSYANAEGARTRLTTPEAQLKMARGLPWSTGILDFIKVLEAWEENGDLSDLDISVIQRRNRLLPMEHLLENLTPSVANI